MKVSITLPVHNNLEGLKKSLWSVMGQTYSNWEVIVVDDGSAENHKKIVEEFNDSRIFFFRFDKNQGRAIARQRTFEMAQGEYCAFLDAGDCYEKNFLENAINTFSAINDLIGVSQTMKIVYKDNIYYSPFDEEMLVDTKSNDYQKIAFASTIIKTKYLKNKSFDASLKHSEDRYLLDQIASNVNGKIILLNTYSYIYNQDRNNARISTTLKKYYYDSLRLFKERKYKESLLSICKACLVSVYHLIFGYRRLLELRYKKEARSS